MEEFVFQTERNISKGSLIVLLHLALQIHILWCWRRLLRIPWTARRSVLGVHWKDWCWSWNSNTLATSCEEQTHLKKPWCWERLRAGGEGDDRRWNGWMASPTQWTWVWVGPGSWWWTRRSGVLQFMGSQSVGYDWVTELIQLNLGEREIICDFFLSSHFTNGIKRYMMCILVFQSVITVPQAMTQKGTES